MSLISNFTKGDRITGFYIIKDYNLRTSSNNKRFLDLTLMDMSGEVDAKKWDATDEEAADFGPGDIVKIMGDVTLWQEKFQLKIVKMRGLEESDEIDYDTLVLAAPIPALEMYENITSLIDDMKDEDLRRLTKEIITGYEKELLYYPAAMRNHHAIRSGLLYHYTRMIKTGKALCEIYGMNFDLLLSGILLHDIEKINEMDSNDLGIVSTYTRDGQLLGHIVQGVINVEKVGKKLGIEDETIKLVQHMILTHHYEPEYGSPKKPMFPEAELLHYVDMIDARMYDMDKALDDTASGEFSQNIFSLDRRKVYKSRFHDK